MLRNGLIGALLSEAVALVIIISFGCSASAMYLLYEPSPYLQSYWGLCITWGLSVTLAIHATASVSGTHANPAVTLAMAMYRGFPWAHVVPYWIAQVAGAFIGASIVYLLYAPVIDHYTALHGLARADGGAAGVFFTAPGLAVSTLHALRNEVILTAFLVFGIFAITERYNEAAPGANGGALMIGLLVACIGASMGHLEGWAINPARDLGPRLFAWLNGWDRAALPAAGYYAWVPVAGPLLGGVIGATAYRWLILPFLPARQHALAGNADATIHTTRSRST